MSKLYRLDASIRTTGSVSRAVADAFQSAARPKFAELIHRDVGLTPLPATAWRDATNSAGLAPDAMSDEQRHARGLATVLADELVAADAYLFAIPLYNFGVAQQAKAWVDLLLTEPRFTPRAPKLLQGRPAYLVTARGGGYAPGTPRHGWDHATPWMMRIFADVLGFDVQPIEVELTLADHTPEMETLRPMAADNFRRALQEATRLGAELADAPRKAVAA